MKIAKRRICDLAEVPFDDAVNVPPPPFVRIEEEEADV